MALAKDHQSFSNENLLEGSSHDQFPNLAFPASSGLYEFINHYHHHERASKEGSHGLESPSGNSSNNNSNNQVTLSHSPPLSSSSSATSSNSGFAFQGSSYHQLEEVDHSLINFKGISYGGGFSQGLSGSLLSFQHDDGWVSQQGYPRLSHPVGDYSLWEGSTKMSQNCHPQQHHQQFKLKDDEATTISSFFDDVNCLQTTSNQQEATNEWLYRDSIVTLDAPHDSGAQQTCFNKRPHMEEENMQGLKKQCSTTSVSKKPTKPNKSSTPKDPQSVAAKNRRERISDRLKILQDLVPNGSKVDLVTMLEKAISYVKFLQLQVKVLATDEFWPTPGGKAPDISQAREAIDAILSSQ